MQMKRIQVLTPNVANKIAAGEVVERPASVIKELVENSIDAESTAITIEIRNGGVDYIRITDNGFGIENGDVEKAFLRHATSKLSSSSDLEHIETLGFRGEALASIASVSKVTIRTRTAEGEYGTNLKIEGGEKIYNEPCGCPCGTTIEVSDLFYNVPARLKFLKSTRVEAANVGDYVTRLILANPSIAIKFINNGKTIYHSMGDGSLSNALFCVYGNEISSRLYPVNFDDGYLKLSGYVGNEYLAKNTRVNQSLFINHRYIKSPAVSSAVQKAFDTRLMHGKFPFFAINVKISSYEIDVNVHPNKLSVRFKDEERVCNSVFSAVVESLSANYNHSIISDNTPSSKELYELFNKDNSNSDAKTINDRTSESYDRLTSVVQSPDKPDVASYSPQFEHKSIVTTTKKAKPLVFRDSGTSTMPPFEHEALNTDFSAGSYIPVIDFNKSSRVKYEIGKPEQIEITDLPYTIIGAAFDTYVIVQQGNAIFYIDQHAAHERILYEKLIKDELKFNSQILLTPQYIHPDPISGQILRDNIDRFIELGFALEFISDTSVRIDAVPSMMKSTNSEVFISNALALIQKNGYVNEVDLIREELIQSACKMAVKAGDRLSKDEITELVNAYRDGKTPLTCPHGRPVIIRITKTELQKMFKRIE